ncbi:MAG TPA: FHA domain-containing protein, partial [Planctomycetota bacterium]|nr:FHA domain-containing protein [Planctomycetota bacterium]
NAPGVRPAFRDPGTPFYPLPPGRAVELAFDLVQALAFLHSRGFAHGRVRPRSLLVRAPCSAESTAKLLANVAEGAFEGVLASLQNVRPLDWHTRSRTGKGGKVSPPEREHLYTPPDLMGEPFAPGEQQAAADIYALGLVFYTLLTGRLPFDAYRAPDLLERSEIVKKLKTSEAKGKLSPLDPSTLDSIPLHDVAVEGSVGGWLRFRAAALHIIERCLDLDPAKRPTADEVREYFEAELRVRWSLASGPRPHSQGIFQMRPDQNRLAGQRDEAITIREEDGQIVETRRPLPTAATVEGAAAPVSADTVVVRGALAGGRPSTVDPPPPRMNAPRGMHFLSDLLRERRDGRPLSVSCPVLVTDTTFSPRSIARCLVFSLGRASTRLRIANTGVEERIRVAVGRAENSDIVVDDPDVSKRHLVLDRRNGRWWVEDVGSTNGTRVDGRPLAKNSPWCLVAPMATIELGPYSMLTYMDEAELLIFMKQALEVLAHLPARGNRVRDVSIPSAEAGPRVPFREDAPTRRLPRPELPPKPTVGPET